MAAVTMMLGSYFLKPSEYVLETAPITSQKIASIRKR
jgi:hypothetical protein